MEVPRTLPNCDLLRLLAEKAQKRHDIEFDFLGMLDAFRRRVSEEVRQINVLFPEYTPHDEDYHLKKLFHVACLVLGRERLEAMNSAELFVLAAGLYGHDWGMAVSEDAKQHILTGDVPAGVSQEDLRVLSDERRRITEFARKQQLPIDDQGRITDMPIELWREYIRQTHAFRSGAYVRRYFGAIDGGVADAAGRVCEGHWLSFEDLQDHRAYPADFSVLGEPANLRALAVYVRMVDLLDLGEDRTPYVMWKFVAPRDRRSRMEWAKHRALHPVTCPPYQQGRIIQVDGGTDDHEVYAALEDLRVWCEEQVRGCNDVLARMNDPRHKLDLYHVDWRVAARGFKPIGIRFEFDRLRMFEILGDEIYQGDAHVFLRELLQNSIDAIRMRREILERAGVLPAQFGEIRVEAKHGKEGDLEVTWRDDGIGMDEYVVRNYVAVAGKSYYQSEDFKREGLKLDPISRFGIGILSCFMPAQRIEIETYKEPHFHPAGEPLRIVIPAVERQFRIETRPPESAKVGTTVRVLVEGKRLPKEADESEPKRLDVTGYLSRVAGFVEFPIVVTEGDRKTIILHPGQDPAAARRRFGEEFHVQQLALGYPWDDVFVPQDLARAREYLREEIYDVQTDLGLAGYEGVVTYAVPKNEMVSSDFFVDLFPGMVLFGKRGDESAESLAARFARDLLAARTRAPRSSASHPWWGVYRDGILIPEAAPPATLAAHKYRASGPQPVVRVNLPKSTVPKTDLARVHLLGSSQRWDAPIFNALLQEFRSQRLGKLANLPPEERLFQLARFLGAYAIGARYVWQDFPAEKWPVACLEPGGRLTVLEFGELAGREVLVLPGGFGEGFEEDSKRMATCQWISRVPYEGALKHWAGEACCVPELGQVPPLGAASDMWDASLGETHTVARVRFLVPPWNGDPPLAQFVLTPKEVGGEKVCAKEFLEKGAEDPLLLSPAEWKNCADLRGLGWADWGLRVELARFQEPFEHRFGYANEVWNLKHAATQAILQVIARWRLAEMADKLAGAQLGELRDAIEAATISHAHNLDIWRGHLREFFALGRRFGLVDIGDVEALIPSAQDFVPGTCEPSRVGFRRPRPSAFRPFGQVLG